MSSSLTSGAFLTRFSISASTTPACSLAACLTKAKIFTKHWKNITSVASVDVCGEVADNNNNAGGHPEMSISKEPWEKTSHICELAGTGYSETKDVEEHASKNNKNIQEIEVVSHSDNLKVDDPDCSWVSEHTSSVESEGPSSWSIRESPI